MSHVFHRVLSRELPRAVRAEGVWIEDARGERYLDAAGGAIVVNVGHGDRALVDAMADQASRTPYVHGALFTTDALEDYADDVATVLPLDDARIYPVSGGSEAVETAIKLARSYHLARGEHTRTLVIGRRASYHGNTLGALDAGGKETLRTPYAAWLGRFRHVEAAYEYRCESPAHPSGCGAWHAERLERAIVEAGPSQVAAFIAEPVAGATLAAAVPTDDYWPAIVDVCRRHGVLVIADEVMTGFGRTGRWFGLDHWGVRADILVAAKGATSGYWPFGFAAASGEVHDAITGAGAFVHGFTYSHSPVGAAVAREVLRILDAESLVVASATKGEHLLASLATRLADERAVGEVRGRGLLVGVELVADRETRAPFPRAARVTERVVAAARERGVLVYSGTGNADGVDGDTILLGPPFVVTDGQLDRIVDVVGEAIDVAVAEVGATAR
ncbi:MAG: aspartate aminotransferase family protein [Actinomycetota bacterium]